MLRMAALCGLAVTALASAPTSAPSSVHFNIEGKPLERCSGSGHALTGWLRNGHCTDRDDDAGSHHICIDMKSTVDGSADKNFCTQTGQSNWCDDEMRCDPFPPVTQGNCPVKNWCVCQWAFRKYIAAAGGCDHIQHIVCDAINMAAITAYKGELAKDPGDMLTKNAYDCLVARCNVEGASKPVELQQTIAPDTPDPSPAPVPSTSVPIPTTPAPIPATNTRDGAIDTKVKVTFEPAEPSALVTHEPVTQNKPTTNYNTATLGDSAADEGTGSTGAVTMAIAGVLGCLALTAGVAAVVVYNSRNRIAQTRKEVAYHLDLSKHLPEHEETPKGSVADIALTTA